MSPFIRRLAGHARHNVVAYLALFVALGGTGAYAANTIGSSDVINESLLSEDLAPGSVKVSEVAIDAVRQAEIITNGVSFAEIAENAVRASEIASGAVGTAELADGAVTRAKLAPNEGWRYVGDTGEPPFLNGWRNYDQTTPHGSSAWQHVAFRKDRDGVVHLAGLIAAGTMGQPFFRLPEAYCPWHIQAFGTVSNNAFARLTVEFAQGDGCDVLAETGDNSWISLTGVRFTEQSFDRPPAGQSGARARR